MRKMTKRLTISGFLVLVYLVMPRAASADETIKLFYYPGPNPYCIGPCGSVNCCITHPK